MVRPNVDPVYLRHHGGFCKVAATHRWRPVLVTRTDHVGRFRAHYRFRYIAGTASIRLRATALAEERWPYAPGSSRPVTVRVSGRSVGS